MPISSHDPMIIAGSNEMFSDEGRTLALLYDNTREYFFLLDTELRIQLFNRFTEEQTLRLIGLQLQKGQSILDLAEPDRVPMLKDLYAQVLKGMSRQAEHSLVLPNGHYFHLMIFYHPARDESGRVVGVIIMAVDITEKKKGEEALARSRETMDLLLDNTDASFIMFNPSLQVTLFNKAAVRFAAAYAGTELHHGTKLSELLQDKPGLDALQKRAFAGETASFEMEYASENRKVILRHQLKPALRPDGSIPALILATQDITEMKHAEEAMKAAEERWRFALEGSNLGLWDWNMETGHVFYSNSYKRMYGYGTDPVPSDAADWMKRVHPDDVEKVNKCLQEHIHQATPYYECTYRLANKEGCYLWINARGMVVSRNEEGKPLRMIGTHDDVTNRKLAEEEYRLFFYKNPLPMWTFDRETLHFLDVNEAAVAHYGYSREEFLAMTLADIRPQEDIVQLKEMVSGTSVNSDVNLASVRHQRKDGTIIHVKITGYVFEKGGRPVTLILAEDITERLRFAENLRLSEKKYRILFDNNPLPCLIFDINSWRIIRVNECALRFYGYSADELEHLPLEELWPEPVRAKQRAELLGGLQKSFNTRIWQHRKKNGEAVPVEINSELIEFEDRPARLIIVKDITEQLRSDEALRISNERFQLAAKATSEAIWEWDIEHGDLYFSPVYKDLFGFELGQGSRYETWEELIHPDERVATAGSFFEAIEDPHQKHWASEYRYLTSNGTYLPVADHCIIIRNTNGKAVKVVGAIQDISQRKKVEQELVQTIELFRYASRATSDAIYDWNLVENKLSWTDGLRKLFGHNPEHTSIGDWEKMLHPEERSDVWNTLWNTIHNTTENLWKKEYRIRDVQGHYHDVLERGFIVRNEHGVAIRMIGAIQDISDLKQKELQLMESNERFKLATRASSDAIYDWDIKTGNLYWGEGLFSVFGHHAKDLSLELWETLIHPDEAKTIISSLQNVLGHPKKKYWKMEYRFRRFDNSYRNVLDNGFIVRDEAGNATRMIGAMQDITDLKEKEQLLLESNERFDMVMRATNDLIWDWNLQTGNFYRDPEGVRKVYGVEDVQGIEDFDNWLPRVHPDDREHLQATIDSILNAPDDNIFESEYRFRKDDGHYVYIYDRGLLIRDADGKPFRLIGAAQDITLRKELEQQLINRELNKQKLISTATIETQERERAEIGKELHDNVNQVLTTTKLYLELTMSNPELKDELIQKSAKNVMYVINEIRQLSRSLMNPSLGDLGLADALNDLTENINLTRHIHIGIQVDPQVETLLSENQKLMIFRIVQEGLNNAIRHAQAKKLELKLRKKGPNMQLRINDNGIGFDPGSIKKGAGLKNIQNRVYLADGTLTIESAPGRGCTLTITFPI